jgi:hypothetical protein
VSSRAGSVNVTETVTAVVAARVREVVQPSLLDSAMRCARRLLAGDGDVVRHASHGVAWHVTAPRPSACIVAHVCLLAPAFLSVKAAALVRVRALLRLSPCHCATVSALRPRSCTIVHEFAACSQSSTVMAVLPLSLSSHQRPQRDASRYAQRDANVCMMGHWSACGSDS